MKSQIQMNVRKKGEKKKKAEQLGKIHRVHLVKWKENVL